MCIGSATPLVGESIVLSTHHNGRTTSHVGIVIKMGILKLGGQNLDISLFQKSDTF